MTEARSGAIIGNEVSISGQARVLKIHELIIKKYVRWVPEHAEYHWGGAVSLFFPFCTYSPIPPELKIPRSCHCHGVLS